MSGSLWCSKNIMMTVSFMAGITAFAKTAVVCSGELMMGLVLGILHNCRLRGEPVRCIVAFMAA